MLGLGALSGVLVGFVLGLVGGGGSILAVPLLVHVVGVSSPHVAIGTSAVAVAINALTSLAMQSARGSVKWRCAALFAGSGVLGAALGSALGKSLDGQKLLAAFGVLMVLVGLAMLRKREGKDRPDVRLTMHSARTLAPRLVGLGFLTGATSGFFGIGGGFLIVPALSFATAMPLEMAIGSSLVAVAAFGITTSLSYATAGLVDWPLAAVFVVGGLLGGLLGTTLTAKLTTHRRALAVAFAVLVIGVGSAIAVQGALTSRAALPAASAATTLARSK